MGPRLGPAAWAGGLGPATWAGGLGPAASDGGLGWRLGLAAETATAPVRRPEGTSVP